MEGLRVSDQSARTGMIIQSHKGPYPVAFHDTVDAAKKDIDPQSTHFLIDENIAILYESSLAGILGGRSVLRIPATEASKSLDRFPSYVAHLVSGQIRREHRLCAIGGGIIQDITCFLAATILRGVPWCFLPTTLLAQADSCIGSKSSINAGGTKNILGTFTPPVEVHICAQFLDTLGEQDLRSGVGEILKVHAIEGPADFEVLSRDYDGLFSNPKLMKNYIRRALDIKKGYIEIDEFDRGPRNIFNYGHSFGHAIEAATHFAVPHGIAVTIGMDMANYIAKHLDGRGSAFDRMHSTLQRNYQGFESVTVPIDDFLTAISKDKKNLGEELTLILPDADGILTKCSRKNDSIFRATCIDYLNIARTA